jgi:VIT1/CCC1 family predicted Fe2+/Mn2+ transporter
MPDHEAKSSKRVLDPLERFSEVLFGLIMVLTFTGSLRVARAGHGQVREMLIGALGCNLAWGLIDGIMYLMANLVERGHGIGILKAVRSARKPEEAHRIIADSMPPIVVSVLPTTVYETMRQSLKTLPEPPSTPHLKWDDWRGAVGVFLLVFASTFPVVIPFIVIQQHVRLALHISDAIAITLLLLTGYSYGRYAGNHPWGWALSMVLIGGVMVGLTIALGG